MRSFSKLRVHCSHPDVLPDRPSKARDDAAANGTLFHRIVQLRVLSGEWPDPADFPHPVSQWLRAMMRVWTPPPGCETELAVGLVDSDECPVYVPVVEDTPHHYVSSNGFGHLLTAGRADLVWVSDGTLHVVDIKTGQSYLGPPHEIPQLRAQAVACATRAGYRKVHIAVYYARLAMFDLSASQTVENLWPSVQRSARMTNEARPGAHCLSCWSKKDCESYPEVR